mmetsp:Transcript_41644/g.75579  ORF Transcript_41644/g.75579 Transcript_41644/m.75579 type:complete len:112 (+) Transcript_41644:88-423(+)
MGGTCSNSPSSNVELVAAKVYEAFDRDGTGELSSRAVPRALDHAAGYLGFSIPPGQHEAVIASCGKQGQSVGEDEFYEILAALCTQCGIRERPLDKMDANHVEKLESDLDW